MSILRGIGIALIAASPLSAQAVSSLTVPGDTTALQGQINTANQNAQTALTTAQQTAANAVTSVNGTAPVNGAVTLDVVKTAAIANFITNAALTNYSTTAQTNTAIGNAIAGISFPVTSVNGNTGAVSVPAYTDAQAVAANSSAISTLTASTVQFVAGGTFIPQATMRGTYPCASGTLGRYARINDMYGNVASVAICETDGTSYYWRPQRTDYAAVISQTSGTITLTPFVTAPVVYLSATPTANVVVTPSTTNVWPGASFHIYAPAAITVGTITIGNLVGGGTVPLLQGSDKILTYTSAGWKSN